MENIRRIMSNYQDAKKWIEQIQAEHVDEELIALTNACIDKSNRYIERAQREEHMTVEKAIELLDKARRAYFSPQLLHIYVEIIKATLQDGSPHDKRVVLDMIPMLSVEPDEYLEWVKEFHLSSNSLVYVYRLMFENYIKQFEVTPEMIAFRTLIRDTEMSESPNPNIMRSYDIWNNLAIDIKDRIPQALTLYPQNKLLQQEFATLLIYQIKYRHLDFVRDYQHLVPLLLSNLKEDIFKFCVRFDNMEAAHILQIDRFDYLAWRAMVVANKNIHDHIDQVFARVNAFDDNVDIDDVIHEKLDELMREETWVPSDELVYLFEMKEYYDAMENREAVKDPIIPFYDNVELILRHLPTRYHPSYLHHEEIFEWYPSLETDRHRIQQARQTLESQTSRPILETSETTEQIRREISVLMDQVMHCGAEKASFVLKNMVLACIKDEREPILQETFSELVKEETPIVFAQDGNMYALSSLEMSGYKPLQVQLDPSQNIILFPAIHNDDPTDIPRLVQALGRCVRGKQHVVMASLDELVRQRDVLQETLDICQSENF